MFSKVFVICALAFVAAAFEDVDIPSTFDTTTKYGMVNPLFKKDIMAKEMMDMPYHRQFWWNNVLRRPLMMNDYTQTLPIRDIVMDSPFKRDMIMKEMAMMDMEDLPMRDIGMGRQDMLIRDMVMNTPFKQDMLMRDLPYTTGTVMTPYELKMRSITRQTLLNKILADYEMKKQHMMMMKMPYYQMMMQNYMMY